MITSSRFSSRLFFILLFIVAGCSGRMGEKPWLSTVPAESPLIILHHDADFFDVLDQQDGLLLQELGSISTGALKEIQDRVTQTLPTKAVALFPTGSHELQPIFIIEDPGVGLSTLASEFRRDYSENKYRFNSRDIHILHIGDEQLYAVQLHDWILFSRNSAAIENSMLTYAGEQPGIMLDESHLQQGDYLVNTPNLNSWVRLLGAPRFLPRFDNLFDGTSPAVLTTTTEAGEDSLYHTTLGGSIPIDDSESSNFVSALTSEPAVFDLDRYIPSDAGFFAVYHDEPASSADSDTGQISDLDSLLVGDSDRYRDLAATLASPTAFVAFEASGFLSTGEHMFIRRLESANSFVQILNQFARDGYIERSNDIYYVSSNVLAKLLGGPFGHFTDFYIMRSANAAVITRRAGLARRVDQDRRRRAVFYYDDDYMEARQKHPESVSVWAYSRSAPLMNYLEPKLNPINHASYLASLADIGAASLVRNGDELTLRLDSYFSEDRSEPVRDLWAFSIGGARITGKPVIVDILGGSRDELLVATDNNQIFGIAADGTGFLEVNTGGDRPVGSPMVYDWYGNNQHAILIAAGNQIYAWNARGAPLPNFPVTMDEPITTPLTLADVSRNGRPEMIVATADRKIHVLDQRGRNISGWPQDVNVQVDKKPEFREFDGERTLWVTAGNGLFGFTPDGNRRERFPIFIESDFGPITFHQNHILAGASDGHLYAIGRSSFFADSLVVALENGNEAEQQNGMEVRRVYVGNSPIINAPIVETLEVSHNGSTVNERMIAIQSLNGNLFLLNETGQLRMSQNMGQTAAGYDNMLITDLNGNGEPEIIGLSETGRIYAWEIKSGERLTDIPAASIRHPIVTDILANGERELIGQTRDGLRAWSIRRQ